LKKPLAMAMRKGNWLFHERLTKTMRNDFSPAPAPQAATVRRSQRARKREVF
jgi:hypothetical protein